MRLFPEGAALERCAALFLGGNDSRQMGARAALYYLERLLAAGRVRPIGGSDRHINKVSLALKVSVLAGVDQFLVLNDFVLPGESHAIR